MLTRTASFASRLLGRESRLIRALRPSYERLLDAASGWQGVEWRVNGEPLRIDPSARRLIASTTEPDLWAWLRSNVRPADRILDVGSFLGTYAVFLSRWAGPDARVLAFEPTPSSVTTLRRHLALNGVADRVTVLPVAAGSSEGTFELKEHSDPYRNSLNVTDPMGVETGRRAISVTTIDAVCGRMAFEPTLLRMDVQGFERDALLGARNVIAAGRGRLRMVLEVHPQLWPQHGFDAAAFDATLAELSLRARPLARNGPGYEPDEHVELEYV